jgi:hypothetical protein
MKNRRNFYRLLKVQPDAPIEIIRASYRTLMKELKLHPDLGGCGEIAAILNEAYEVLSDPARRALYDRQLAIRFSRQAPAPPIKSRTSQPAFSCAFCAKKLVKKPSAGERCPNCESPLLSQEMADLEEASRRSVARMKHEELVIYWTKWPQKGSEGRLIDLSPKGTRFVCGEALRPGSLIKISSSSFDAVAAIRNIHRETDSGRQLYSIGASFVAVRFGDRKGTFLSTRA